MQLHMDMQEQLADYEAGASNMEPAQPFEVISAKFQEIAHRSSLDSFIFPVASLFPMLCRYAWEEGQDGSLGADASWPVMLFIKMGISHDMCVRVLEHLLDSNDVPFHGHLTPAKTRLAEWITYAVASWLRELGRGSIGGLRNDQGMGPWVKELLVRAVEEIPGSGKNDGGACDVPELRRRVQDVIKRTSGVVGDDFGF